MNFYKHLFCFVTLLTIYSQLSYSQQQVKLNSNAEIITAELHFAAMAKQKGIKDAFIQNLDSNGLILAGNRFVNGLKAYAKAPADTTDLLAWRPTYAVVNESNTFGFTTGPYLYYPKRGEKAAGSGYYFSIWKKNAHNQFKLMFDGGIVHNKFNNQSLSTFPSARIRILTPQNESTAAIQATVDHFNKEFDSLGNRAYQSYLSKTALILRPDTPIFQNPKTFLMVSSRQKEKKLYSFHKGSRFDQSQQIYYDYGNLATSEEQLKKAIFCGYYVRIWQLEAKGWKIIADVKQYD